MVSGTAAVGGTLRCVTLATKDSLALERWTNLLEQVRVTTHCLPLSRVRILDQTSGRSLAALDLLDAYVSTRHIQYEVVVRRGAHMDCSNRTTGT